MRNRLLALAVIGLAAAATLASEVVGVDGSDATFVTPVVRKLNGKEVKLVLTGTAMRKKLFFNVYAMASYIQEGVRARSAEELAAANCFKQLHLVMQRSVDGATMAEAFQAAVRANYPAPAFEQELATLGEYMKNNPVSEGDQVFLTHLPGVGLHVNVVGKAEMMIKNAAFPRAVWDIYLGRNNLGDAIKKGLTSRL
jgi:hypothetical protein